MNLQQMRYVLEVARCGLNVSEAAVALHTSQPGVSRQIRVLEQELGVDVFVRQGKRLTGVTAPGQEILKIAGRMLQDVDNLRGVGREFSNEESGSLSIATTHTQARYMLPGVIQQFMQRYPAVRVSLHQGSPAQVCEYVLTGEADIAIATEAIGNQEQLVMLPCYQWNRCVIAPPRHPILKARPLTLEEIAKYPIITYDYAFTGRSQINRAFAARGLSPNVVLTAIDADIIKTYVALGLGVGIMAAMAYQEKTDRGLRALDAADLFESATTRIGVMKNAYLRGYAYAFIELFAPQLTRRAVEAALSGNEGSDPGL
ncbi:MAG TPA: HTH-type transcriptional regulator CysB [Rhodocyclaceae bacterium]|nr:HTH-type transcriptional regulator CysB [Rhodocyclaceae bacterium]